MSMKRALIRNQARSDYRANEIVENKAPCGKTQKLRVALAGNNPSVGKRAFTAQKKYGKMTRHARLVVALLIRAVGGSAPTAPTNTYIAPPMVDRITRLGTNITRRYEIVASKPKAGKSHFAVESRHQRIARKGMAASRVKTANAEVLAKLLAGEYGTAGVAARATV